MMASINEILLAASSSVAGSIVVKATVAVAMGLIGAWLGGGSRAAVRHALLAATFGVLVLTPIAAVWMPPVRVGVPVNTRAAMLPIVTNVDGSNSPVAIVGAEVWARATHGFGVSLADLTLAGWAMGVAIFLVPMVVGGWKIRLLRRSGLPWGRGQSVVESLTCQAGIRRRVEVLLHEGLPGPMVCGVLRPTIILPWDAENWSEEDLNRAMVDELEHVRRGDSVIRFLARAICAVYWFHPLMWIAWRKLVLEAERACDDAVLRVSEATAYADQLVRLARRLSVAQRSSLVAMANRAELATRVGAVLDEQQRRGRAGMVRVALVCGAAAALVIAVSPIKLAGAPQETPSTKTATPRFEVASIRECTEADFTAYINALTAGGGGRGGGGGPFGNVGDAGMLRLVCRGMKSLIAQAYLTYANGVAAKTASFSVGPTVRGGPDWIEKERYTVVAKPQGAQSFAMMAGPMMQALLEDRFKLKIHHASEENSAYALVAAKGGPKLQRTPEGSCTSDGQQGPRPAVVPGQPPPCGYYGGEPEGVKAVGVTIDTLCAPLSALVHREVIDKTGLAGLYSFTLDVNVPPPDAPEEPGAFDATIAALEKLGLRLESAKAADEFVVIDHIERPTEN